MATNFSEPTVAGEARDVTEMRCLVVKGRAMVTAARLELELPGVSLPLSPGSGPRAPPLADLWSGLDRCAQKASILAAAVLHATAVADCLARELRAAIACSERWLAAIQDQITAALLSRSLHSDDFARCIPGLLNVLAVTGCLFHNLAVILTMDTEEAQVASIADFGIRNLIRLAQYTGHL